MQSVTLIEQELPYEINEELKLLRTNIQFSGDDKRVILLTSSFSGEGKSTLSLFLARSFAELDKKTLYIDADMRKSQILSRFKDPDVKYGLSHYLSGQCTLNDMICKTDLPNLFVAASVQVPPNPVELISGPKFKALTDSCRKVFDYVIIDCSPLGMVVDAAAAAPSCDGVIIILEAGAVKYRMAQEMVSKLQGAGCPILGTVLNKVNRHRTGKYYGKYYGKYGKYYGRYGKYYGEYGKYGEDGKS